MLNREYLVGLVYFKNVVKLWNLTLTFKIYRRKFVIELFPNSIAMSFCYEKLMDYNTIKQTLMEIPSIIEHIWNLITFHVWIIKAQFIPPISLSLLPGNEYEHNQLKIQSKSL